MLPHLRRYCTICALLLSLVFPGCVGRLGERQVIDVELLDAKASPPLPAAGIIPRPALGSECSVLAYAELAAAEAAGIGTASPRAALRPGVGARLGLSTLTIGIDPEKAFYGNQSPTVFGPVDVALRLHADGTRLDADEARTLATFLTTNRTYWVVGNDPSEPGEPVTTADRRLLARAVDSAQAKLWNALVATLCIKVYDAQPAGGVAVEAAADILALCRAMPVDDQLIFARSFVDERIQTSTLDKPCGEDEDLGNGKRVGKELWRSLVGLSAASGRSGWSAAMLGVAPDAEHYHYFDGARSGSPVVLLGAPEIEAIRPSMPEPSWSLLSWEASGICAPRDRAETARIAKLKLRGGNDAVEVLAPIDAGRATYEIKDGLGERLRKLKKGIVFPRIAHADLSRLTTSDVDWIRWVDGRGWPVKVRGCTTLR